VKASTHRAGHLARPAAALIGVSSPDLGPAACPPVEAASRPGYTLGPSARGKGTGTATVAALVRWLAAVQEMRRITGVTGPRTPLRCGCSNAGVSPHGPLADTGEARCTLSLGERPIPIPGAARQFLRAPITCIRAPAGRKNPAAVDANRAGRNAAAILHAGRVRSRGQGQRLRR
jgi:hypothetical protein